MFDSSLCITGRSCSYLKLHTRLSVPDSMADKSHLRVGDELFSVDNLCCSRTPDRPLIVANLKKMHLLLDRLSARQRPVEVKVFRGRRLDTIGMKCSTTAMSYHFPC